MKKNKRIFLSVVAVFLSLTMVLGGVITVAAQEDDYAVTADVLNRAGLLEALKISQYGGVGITEWSGNLTRGEAAFLVAGLIGSPREKKESVFSDINLNAYYAGAIASLYEEGIVLKEWGSSRYKPDSPITYAEFVAMICRALGYTGYAESKGGYPLGYISVAKQFKITRGAAPVNGNIDKTLVPEIIMNALDAYYLAVSSVDSTGNVDSQARGKVLNDFFDVKTYEGLVKEAGYYTMTGNFQSTGGRINVGDINFYIDGAEYDYEKYVGQYAVIYYTGNKQAVYVYPTEENTLTTIDALDLCTYDDGANYIEYYDEEGEIQEIELELGYVTTYNGVKTSGLTVPDYGHVTFIDNDDDGEVEVVKVKDYFVSEIVGFDTVNDTFSILKEDGSVVVIKEKDTENYRIVNNSTGKEVKIPSLNIGDKILCSASVPRTESNTTYDMILLKKTIEGKISAFTEEEICIGTKFYRMSGLFDTTGASLGNSATVYLDDNDVAIFMEYSGYNYLDSKYALILDFDHIRGGEEDEWSVEMFTQDNELVELPLAEKVRINGTRYKREETAGFNTIKTTIEESMTTGETNVVLVKFKSFGGELTEILTVTPENDWGTVFKPWEFGNGFNKYKLNDTSIKWRLGVGGQFNSSVYLAKDAVRVFVQFKDGKFDPEFSQMTTARMEDDTTASVTFYDIDKYGMPHAYIVTSTNDNSLKTKDTASDSVNLLAVTNVVDGVDEEGEACKYVFGILKGNEAEFYVTAEDWAAKSTLRDAIQPGNLVRIMTQGKKITAIKGQRETGANAGVPVYYSKETLTNPTLAIPDTADAGRFKSNTLMDIDYGGVTQRYKYVVIGKIISVEDGYVTFSENPNIKSTLESGSKNIVKLAQAGAVMKFDATARTPFSVADWKDVRPSTNVDSSSYADSSAEFDGSTVVFNIEGYAILEIIILD